MCHSNVFWCWHVKSNESTTESMIGKMSTDIFVSYGVECTSRCTNLMPQSKIEQLIITVLYVTTISNDGMYVQVCTIHNYIVS